MRGFRLSASAAKVNLGQGPDFVALTFNGQVPGPEIRVREGEVIKVVLKNYLPEGGFHNYQLIRVHHAAASVRRGGASQQSRFLLGKEG